MARQRSSNIFGLLILVVGIVAGYIFYSNLLKPAVPTAPRSYDDLLRYRDLVLDFTVIDRGEFENLKVFGQLPVEPGATGRQDIFAPF